MKFHALLLVIALSHESGFAFQNPLTRSGSASGAATALFAKSRKARKIIVDKQTMGKPNKLFEALEDADGKKKKKKKDKPKDEMTEKEAYLADAEERMAMRPEVSTMITDEESGMEILVQGRSVMDVVTRKAVKLSDLGAEYRLAQMFPGVPPDIREKHRLDFKTIEVPEIVEKLRAACSVKREDGTIGIPPHPNVANKGLDFVLTNRDLLGYRMKRTLVRLQLRAMSLGNEQEARDYKDLSLNFETLENHISAPFRQILQDAEGRVGPNFGNLDITKYCGGDLYERVGNYLVLKGMVAHWEKKVVDADYVEKTPQTKENFVSILSVGDPKRYLPESPILYTLKECTQVCAMAQQMCRLFVETEELFGDFPPEVVFFEEAMKIKGGASLRKYMIDDFCPARGITPEGLREGMQRLYQQLENMQIDPYGDITNKVQELHWAMSVGSDDERNPYEIYLANVSPDSPGYFQSYTFNHAKKSLVRFLDSQYASSDRSREKQTDEPKQQYAPGLAGIFGIGRGETPLRTEPKPDEKWEYTVPKERAMGRPHNLNWLEMLDKKKEDRVPMGQVSPGRIIPDDE